MANQSVGANQGGMFTRKLYWCTLIMFICFIAKTLVCHQQGIGNCISIYMVQFPSGNNSVSRTGYKQEVNQNFKLLRVVPQLFSCSEDQWATVWSISNINATCDGVPNLF